MHNRTGKRLCANTILDGYLDTGLSWFDGVRGRFSFVVCDERQRILAGGRDVLGRCGLAWHSDGDEFWFSTRVIDLLPVIRRGIHWDRVYLADWLLGLASQGQVGTPFEEIKRCQPGEVIYRDGAEIRHRQFDSIRGDGIRQELASGVEQFQSLAERGMLEFDERAVLLLSGGIDSMALAAAWSRSRPFFHALTYRLPDEVVSPEDNRRLCRLEDGGKVNRREFRIPSSVFDREWLGNWLTESARLFDDPPVGSPALLPARWLTYQQAGQQGFEVAINGEGGDEIFEIAASPFDLWRERARLRAIVILLLDNRYRSPLAWRRFLSQAFESQLGYSEAQSSNDQSLIFPLGLSADFRNSDEAIAALNAFARRIQLKRFPDRMKAVLLSGASENARCAAEALGESVGVQVESPLWEPGIAELANSLRAADRLRLSLSKPLLVEAHRAWGDEEILSRPASDSGYARVVDATAAGLSTLLSQRVRAVDLLSSWIEPEIFSPDRRGAGSQERIDAEFAIRLCFGATWMSTVQSGQNIH